MRARGGRRANLGGLGLGAACAAAAVSLLASCTSIDGAARGSGRLAFSELGTGDVVVLDVDVGMTHRLSTPVGPAGTLSLSPDGRRIAFSVSPAGSGRRAFDGEIETGAVSEVTPGTGGMMAAFEWGVGGWFWYSLGGGGGGFSTLVAPADGSSTRAIGVRAEPEVLATIVASPTEPRFAYAECRTARVGAACPMQLVTERVDGGDRRTLVEGLPAIRALAFSPSGDAVAAEEGDLPALRLVVHPIDGSGSRDMGDAAPAFELAYGARSGTLFSPDGTEILAIRSGALAAVCIADGEARVLSADRPSFAAFTAAGDILYEIAVNTNPGSDLLSFVYTTFLVSGDSERVLGERDSRCQTAALSSDGRRVAIRCGEELVVYEVPSARVLWRGPGFHVIDFDPNGQGLFFAQPASTSPLAYEMRHAQFSGTVTTLGTAGYLGDAGAVVEWPPFDFVVPTER